MFRSLLFEIFDLPVGWQKLNMGQSIREWTK